MWDCSVHSSNATVYHLSISLRRCRRRTSPELVLMARDGSAARASLDACFLRLGSAFQALRRSRSILTLSSVSIFVVDVLRADISLRGVVALAPELPYNGRRTVLFVQLQEVRLPALPILF